MRASKLKKEVATIAKKQIKTTAVNVPVFQVEAEKALGNIGQLQREVTRIEASMNDEMARIKDKYEKQAQPVNEKIENIFHGLHMWAEANRSRLLKGKSKTVKLSTGVILWRTTPPSVRITKVLVVIEELKQKRLRNLIRTKEEVNKEAILADPSRVKDIKGIKIKQQEEFVAKPFETEIERVEPVKKTHKRAG